MLLKNIASKQIKQNLTELHGKKLHRKSTIIRGYFNTHLSIINKQARQKSINQHKLISYKSIQFNSVAQSYPTLWDLNGLQHTRPRITDPQSLLKLMSIELVMPPNHLILYRPLLLSPSIFPSIRIFSNESVLLIRMPKYWRFSFSISTSSEYLGLISLRMDWLDLFAVHGTLKSLLQHHSSKASILHQF